MEFRSSRHHKILVYSLSGYVKDDANGYRFVRHARQRIASGNRKIVIDLGEVEVIDSSGIGILATVLTSANKANATLLFTNIPEKVEQILSIVGLMQVLDVHPSLPDALASLAETS